MSKAAELIRERIAEIDAETKPVLAGIQGLLDEKEELQHDARRIERGDIVRRKKKDPTSGNGSAGALISDERVIEVLRTLGGAQRSPAVANELGVKVQAVSRQLSRMSKENVITGDKSDGYAAIPLAAD